MSKQLLNEKTFSAESVGVFTADRPVTQTMTYGGTIVRSDGASLGPDSVGYLLLQEGLAFGGSTLTATDIALRIGAAQIDGIVALIMGLDRACRQEVFTSVYDKRGPLFITMSDERVQNGR